MNNRAMLYCGAVVVGLLLASNPRCNHGCKTLAQHIWIDGVDGLLGTLFA
jgi:hypothetical protein